MLQVWRRASTDRGDLLVILWTEDEFRELLKKGEELYANPQGLPDYAGPALMAHTLLLDESFRRLIKQAGSAEKLDDAIKMIGLAYKGHDAWRGIMEPLSKRVMTDMKKELKSGSRKQVSGHSRPGLEAGDGRRGRAGESGSQTDSTEGGSPQPVEGRLLGVPDGERS
jgi:hypothetical protein